MRILHIPTAIEYEWNTYSDEDPSFSEVSCCAMIHINDSLGDARVAMDYWIINDYHIRYPHEFRPKYEFIVVEE